MKSLKSRLKCKNKGLNLGGGLFLVEFGSAYPQRPGFDRLCGLLKLVRAPELVDHRRHLRHRRHVWGEG